MREEERPELEEGEFYTRDLVGMRVLLKVCAHHAYFFYFSEKFICFSKNNAFLFASVFRLCSLLQMNLMLSRYF